MRYTARGRHRGIPSITTSKSQPQPLDYKKGYYTGVPNDLQPKHTLPYVVDMRFAGLGKYITRKGCDPYTVPIGEAVNVQVTSTTGAADAGYSTTTYLAEKVTAASSGVCSRIDVNIKNSASATGTTTIQLYSDGSGEPGDLLETSSIPSSDVATSYNYETVRSMKLPAVTAGTAYWVVVHLQDSGTGTMYVSSTTNSTNAKVSTDQGQTWTAATYSLNVKLYTATAGGVKGVRRVTRPNGESITFFAHGSSIYKVNDGDGSTTPIDTISSSSSTVRFAYVRDTLYYTDGVGKPRKYDHTSAAEITAAPHAARNIIDHVGLLWFMNADDNNGGYYSNFEDYETFTSTDFFNVPAPNTADPLTAWAKLSGVLYMFTKVSKHMVLGQDTATFQPGEAYAKKGTFSQESVVADKDAIYFASDDGVYKFNGTSEKNILEGVIGDYTSILYKDDIHLDLYDNRLYIWYRPNGQAEVNECFVYNTLYDVIEAKDENTYIGRSVSHHDASGGFLQASNRAGVIYYGERQSNGYHNLGAPLAAEVRTAYDHFGTPQQVKRIPIWRPIIETTQGAYTMQAGFAADYSDDANFRDVSLQGSGYTYDDPGTLYDSATYASSGVAIDTTLNIYGSAYRWQRRYKHHAAHEPFVFAGEVLTIETQRLR